MAPVVSWEISRNAMMIRRFSAMLGGVFARDLRLLGFFLFLATFAFPAGEMTTIYFDHAAQLVLAGRNHDGFAEFMEQREGGPILATDHSPQGECGKAFLIDHECEESQDQLPEANLPVSEWRARGHRKGMEAVLASPLPTGADVVMPVSDAAFRTYLMIDTAPAQFGQQHAAGSSVIAPIDY